MYRAISHMIFDPLSQLLFVWSVKIGDNLFITLIYQRTVISCIHTRCQVTFLTVKQLYLPKNEFLFKETQNHNL